VNPDNRPDVNQWLRSIIRLHFDPEQGSRYWVEKACRLGMDPAHDITCVENLAAFGPMNIQDLGKRPMEDFVPRCFHPDKSAWVVGETGGTMGDPKPTVYLADEFQAAFVRPFVAAAAYRGFPRGLNWLWVGPSGPHIIGKAARACARALASPDPFAVDFDPRWAKKFPPESIAFKRYLDHVVEQAMRIIGSQNVGVLFSTPPVLIRLGEIMSTKQRDAIQGIHFGGMALDRDLFKSIADRFAHAIFISGYGNTLFGMCPEFTGDPDLPMEYYPAGVRLILSIVSADSGLTPAQKLRRPLDPGQTGQVVFSRLDKSFLIINQIERDGGESLEPNPLLKKLGFTGRGVRNPGPLPLEGDHGEAVVGLY
jgi:hypothetical protein